MEDKGEFVNEASESPAEEQQGWTLGNNNTRYVLSCSAFLIIRRYRNLTVGYGHSFQ